MAYEPQGLTYRHFNHDIGNHRSVSAALKRHGVHDDTLKLVEEHLFSERIQDRHLKEIIGREGINLGNLDKVMSRLREHPEIHLDEREIMNVRRGLEDRIRAVVVPKEI